ncbi:choice-of-anchor X domain-containing protein [Candidatus Margulisiibacteriota bacterium]
MLILIVALSGPVAAAKKAHAAEKTVLTKGQAIMLLSATDFMKKKIGKLLSWTIGYDISMISKVKLTPTINYVRAVPKRVPPDGRTVVEIVASINDPGGMANIAGVRADLSSIGRLPNTMLVDNGLFGDSKAADGIYTLQTSVPSKIDVGNKEVPVAVANKKGWLALAKTSLDIKKNPIIAMARFSPDWLRADGKSVGLLTVKVDNPGRQEDLEGVTADLRALGFAEFQQLRNDGQKGDAVAGDGTYSLQFVVSQAVKPGKYNIRIGAANYAGGYAARDVELNISK